MNYCQLRSGESVAHAFVKEHMPVLRHAAPPRRLPARLNPFRSVRSLGAVVVAVLLLPIAAACVPAPPRILPTALHVNFQPATGVAAPRGYTVDSGAAFNGTRGWETLGGLPLDLRGNVQVRHSALSPDVRYDTLQQMQAPRGNPVTTPARWAAALRNGVYNVTVTVGDAGSLNSAHSITAQSGTLNRVVMINRFKPTSGQRWLTVSKRVTVSNGLLTLDPSGGSNTKIDFVEAVLVTTPAPRALAHGPLDSVLKLPSARVVFSAVRFGPAAAPQVARIYNTGQRPLVISRLSVLGADAAQFVLRSGQPTTITIPVGRTVDVPISFRPVAPTNCPTSGNEFSIANQTRSAQLRFFTNDPSHPLASIDLAGVYACGFEHSNEPLLDQILSTLGYADRVVPAGSIPFVRRVLGPATFLPGTDEVSTPYFRAANPALPVTLTPLARYSGRDRNPAGTNRTGWFLKGSAPTAPCNAACRGIFTFAPDGQFNYVQNQKLLPAVSGTTSFRPTGAFGIFSGDGREVAFSDDRLNAAHTNSGAVVQPVRYLHDMRVYPALGAGRVPIANTFLVAIDVSLVPSDKNYDYQDVVFVLSNVVRG